MTDLIGGAFGQYQIIDEIGHGGMANVYRALQTSINREVAIKVLPAHFLQDRTFPERFTREVQVIARLQHPRILPVYDFGQYEGLPYIVMAYMPAGALSSRIADAPRGMALDEVARLVDQMAEGLDFAHKQGIIHRDFKPSNVLMDNVGNCYLADFGIAKVSESTAQLTGSAIVGTPGFMAPEMAEPGGVTHLVDVYALGVTAYQMLTGKQPYDADTPIGMLMAHTTKPIPAILSVRRDLPTTMQEFVNRAMAKDPLQRYQSAGELAKGLRTGIGGSASGERTEVFQGAAMTPTQELPSARPDVTEQWSTPPALADAVGSPRKAAPRPAARRSNLGMVIAGGLGLALCLAVVVVGAVLLLNPTDGASVLPLGQPAQKEGGQEAGPDADQGGDQSGSGGGGGGGEPSGTGPTPTARPRPAPAKDTLIICMASEPDSLYRVASNMAVSVQVLMASHSGGWYSDRAFFYESRALVNGEFPGFENGDAVLNGDVLSVTYRFRPDMRWSDGEPFTVDDILFTREVVIDPDSGATSRGFLDQMTFEKIDDYMLKVTYPPGIKDPLFFLPPLMSAEGTSDALPEHILGGMSPASILDSDYARLPNPTLGPYEYVEWVEGDHITLRAVDDWWGGEVITPNLIFRIVGDSNQLIPAVLSGECDYATYDGLTLAQLPSIQQSASQGLIQYDATPSLVWEHIDFNTTPPNSAERNGLAFFADARTRQAVAYGTNRQQMTEQILYGEVHPLNSYLPGDHWAYNPDLDGSYPYDPDRARQLLEEVGWIDGDSDGVRESTGISGQFSCGRGSYFIPALTRFEVDFHTTSGNPMRDSLSALFQDDMAGIGIKINLDLLPASVWFGDDGPLYQRTYQIGEFAWVAGADPSVWTLYGGMNVYHTPDGEFLAAQTILDQGVSLSRITNDEFMFGRPDDFQLPSGYTLASGGQIPSEDNNFEGQNTPGWCDVEATQLLFDADNALAPAERLPYFLDFQTIFRDQLPVLPLFQRVKIEARVNGLCGPQPGPANFSTWNVFEWYLSSTGECP